MSVWDIQGGNRRPRENSGALRWQRVGLDRFKINNLMVSKINMGDSREKNIFKVGGG